MPYRSTLTHQHQLFGHGRVKSNRGVEIRFLELGLDRDRRRLEDFGRVWADHVDTDDLVGRAVDDQFVERAFIAAGKHVLHRPEIRRDRKSTRLNSSHITISYAVFCLKKKKKKKHTIKLKKKKKK